MQAFKLNHLFLPVGLVLYQQCSASAFVTQGTSVLSPGIPITAMIFMALAVRKYSISLIYDRHPVLFVMTFGIIASKLSNRLVVSSDLEHV